MPIDNSYHSISTQLEKFEPVEQEIREKYRRKIVAVQDGKVIGVGKTLEEASSRISSEKLRKPLLYVAT